MNSIKEISKCIPIIYRNRKLNFITLDDLDVYCDILRSDFYNKYMDFSFKHDITLSKLKGILYNNILFNKMNTPNTYEARLILKDIDNQHIIGGCTIFEKDAGTVLEIAYFILPEYQGHGEALEMLKVLLKVLSASNIKFTRFRAITQDINMGSVKILDKLSFNVIRTFNGKVTKNLVFERNRV